MGKIGKSYAGVGGMAVANRDERRWFLDDTFDPRGTLLRNQVTLGIVSVLCLLALLGWVLQL